MNRFSPVLSSWLRPCGRSHQIAGTCQSYHFKIDLHRHRVGDPTSRKSSSHSRNIRFGSTRSFQSKPEATLDEEPASQVKSFSEIPGPKPWPIVKNLLQFATRKDFDISRLHVLWGNIFRDYGPLVKIALPGTPIIVATLNPDDLAVMMKSTMNNPIRNSFKSLKLVRDNARDNYFEKRAGLLPENGEEWWRLRSRVQGPLLRPKNVASYLPQVDRATLTYMDRIDLLQKETGRMPDNFVEDIYKWALECVGLVALNKDLGCLDPDLKDDSVQMQMILLINDIVRALNGTEIGIKTWKLYRSTAYVKLETAHNVFLEIADNAIQEASRNLEKAKAKGDPNRTLTVMETFLNTEGVSKSDMATMVLDMLIAGVDTTSHTLAFTLYLLAKNPDAQKKLQQEVDSVLGDATELLPDHIAEMTYLNHVVKESLRIYPLTVGNARVLTEDVVLSRYEVLAGTLVFGLNMLICQEEKHFQKADKFLPERWNRDRPYGPIHPFASLPFSHGKRMCIGKRIAEQEIYTFLIRAMQKYSVTIESQQEMVVKTQLVLKPNIPLPFKFHPRKKEAASE